MLKVCTTFWRSRPALLYGLALLLGCFYALGESPWILPALLLFGLIPFCERTDACRLGLALLLMGTSAYYVSQRVTFTSLPIEGLQVEGLFSIDSLSTSNTHFGSFWVYKGRLAPFNLPVRITLPQRRDLQRPPANCAYHVQGLLKESPGGTYILQVNRNLPWMAVKGSFSLAELRFSAKNAVSRRIHHAIPDRRSADFLAGIATGDFENRLMQFEFGRFGLQHIMAISGFHFAILAGILSFGLRLLFDRKRSSWVLIVLLSSYFVFLGASPSVFRAWITALIVLAGYLLEKQGNGLNSLGIALLLILLYDPLLCQSVGFQFSFVATAAILLLFKPFDILLQKLFQKRPLSQTSTMNGLNQHGYLFLSYFRQALALTLAVNLVTMPLMLHYFHKFALMGLVYNLFFPFLVSLAMLLLLLSFLCPWLHALNSMYTRFVLDFTYNMPANVDVIWRVDAFPAWGVVGWLTVMLIWGMWANQKRPSEEWAFL